jgi:general secretion pathway protein E
LRASSATRPGEAVSSPLGRIASFRFPSKNPRREFIDDEELSRVFAEATNVVFMRIDPLKLDARKLAAIVSKPFALKHLMVPVRLEGRRLHVAMVNPYDRTAIHNIEHATGYSVEPLLGLRTEILKTINEIFAFERSLQKAEKMRTASLDIGNLEQLVDVRGDEELDSSDQHVVRAVDLLLQYAFEQRASDIHIEPKRERAVVRLRIDGCSARHPLDPQAGLSVVRVAHQDHVAARYLGETPAAGWPHQVGVQGQRDRAARIDGARGVRREDRDSHF